MELPGGAVTWHAPAGEGRAAATLGPHLYDGVAGVALFLAALDRVRGGREHSELALRAVEPLRRAFRQLARDPDRAGRLRLQTGGMVGLGSAVYAFTRLGQWLDEASLLEDAHAVTALLTPARIAEDTKLDVVEGCAGAILALLALDAAAPGADAPLRIAAACAAHLLRARASAGGAPRAWAAAGKPALGGFAHGAAGIAHALLRLGARTGDEALREAAVEGFAFERTLYDPAAGEWLDPRTGRPLELCAWCHGSPGAALARAASLDVHGGAAVREELGWFLRDTRTRADDSLDHLCCGNLGRAEILLSAHLALGDAALLDEARAVAGRALRRARAAGGFALTRPGEAPGFRPAFFRGVSGVGYALLQLAAPGTLPCILRLE
ncbi:MAG: hypothetical protein JO306_01140 [Gemmatimonadetes bacterium]|nr:hypothetical protein [Gemmatimonadota bacterium]